MANRMAMERVAEIASEQWGLVTRRQAEIARIPATTLDRLTGPGGDLVRVAFGVYQLRGTPTPDHLDLRAAWLQLAPGVFAWDRSVAQGVVSHRSAAAVYGVGHLPADVHEFTVPARRQTRRADVRIHVRSLGADEVAVAHGLPVTRLPRVVSDLMHDHEDPEAIAQDIVEAIRGTLDYPGVFVDAVAPYAGRFGFPRGDGLALLEWLLELSAAPEARRWTDEARADLERAPGRVSTAGSRFDDYVAEVEARADGVQHGVLDAYTEHFDAERGRLFEVPLQLAAAREAAHLTQRSRTGSG